MLAGKKTIEDEGMVLDRADDASSSAQMLASAGKSIGQGVCHRLGVLLQSERRRILKGRQARLQFASTRRVQGSKLRKEYNIDAIGVGGI